ncbi:MAG: alpha/beta hydrolase-fold protein [Polyangiales bacterium]
MVAWRYGLAGLLFACGCAAAVFSTRQAHARVRVPTELHVLQQVDGALAAGQRHSYRLPLAQRDCAFGVVQRADAALTLRVLRPSSQATGTDAARVSRTLRSFTGEAGQPLEFELCVEPAGDYELEIALAPDTRPPSPHPTTAAVRYGLLLERILSRATRSAPTRPVQRVVSPRLRDLDLALRTDEHAEREFWREIDQSGTPLVETLDAERALVTFLYRGDPPVHGVSVSWPLYSEAFALNELQRLQTSDVWWLSVELPKATRLSYQLVIDPPQLTEADQHLRERIDRAVARADPRNRQVMSADPQLDAYRQRSVVALPLAPPELASVTTPVPHGRLERQRFHSPSLDASYPLTIYLPPGVTPRSKGTLYPLLIVFDGEQYLSPMETPALLDRLTAQHEITTPITVFVHNSGPETRSHDLPCNARFAQFVARELLPYVRERYPVSRDPKRVGLLGASFGGLASTYIAFSYPELFGKVLSQSGSYWWTPARGDAAYDGSGEPGWLRRRFEEKKALPLALYMSAGSFETFVDGRGILQQSRLMRDSLRALGYSIAYQEFVGGHDVLAWRATLPEAIRALFPPGS